MLQHFKKVPIYVLKLQFLRERPVWTAPVSGESIFGLSDYLKKINYGGAFYLRIVYWYTTKPQGRNFCLMKKFGVNMAIFDYFESYLMMPILYQILDFWKNISKKWIGEGMLVQNFKPIGHGTTLTDLIFESVIKIP